MTTDDRRYKVRIDGVWTGESGTVHTPEELLEELEYANPILKSVKLLSKPKWICLVEDLKHQAFSFIVLEFGAEDHATRMLDKQNFALYPKWCMAVKHADPQYYNARTAGALDTTLLAAEWNPGAGSAQEPTMRDSTQRTRTWMNQANT
ncbi:hypothetical protein H2248_012656 [Termitomyces sp. 'cryptogamus']|nr:hypothetical protein H2248_012656 [Termitomyces sp. 'cryptogamus']